MQLNEEQQKAVCHDRGPAMVIAGPGSGKTRVLVLRVLALIQKNPALASHILVVTFTKAAAKEMAERFSKLTNNASLGVVFSTFHGIFYYILRQGYPKQWEVIGEDKQRKMMLQILGAYFSTHQVSDDMVKDILEEISKVKNHCIDVDHYYSPNMEAHRFREIYHHYQSQLAKIGAIDFDDILLFTYELLKSHPNLCQRWQDKFQYIMIDEFQDINPLQYEIVKLLVGKKQNLYIVGDDDQSIYGFRGAAPEIMLGFEKDYPTATRYLLSTNYRCQGAIVSAANQLIAHNRQRFKKALKSHYLDGEKVKVHRFKDSLREADYIARYLKEIDASKKVGILYRVHTEAQMMVSKLMEYNLSFSIKDQVPNVYDHWIGKDMIAYFRLALGQYKSADFLRIMNKPLRYIKRDSVGVHQFRWGELYDYYQDQSWMKKRIEEMEEDIDYMSGLPVYQSLLYLRYEVGYEDYLKEYAQEKGITLDDLKDVLHTIQEQAREFKTYEDWFGMIGAYKEKLAQSKIEERAKSGIFLSTIHGSKGLEYDEVFILGVNEDVIPYHKMTSRGEIEEERRLLYVGMTRAKQKLNLCFVKEKYQHPLYPSRFLKEIF